MHIRRNCGLCGEWPNSLSTLETLYNWRTPACHVDTWCWHFFPVVCCRLLSPGRAAGIPGDVTESSVNRTRVETPTHAWDFPVQGHSSAIYCFAYTCI